MKRFVSVISLSIIFGMLISWLERALPLFNLFAFNTVDIPFLFFLVSLLVVFLVSSFADNMISAILSVLVFVVSYLGVCFYLGAGIDYPLIVRLAIILISGIWLSVFLHTGRSIAVKTPRKIRVRHDMEFSVLFFFASALFALSVTLMEQNLIMFDVVKVFYGYLYFMVAVLLGFAFLSFHEVAGFVIGLVSLPVYFLAMSLVRNNFDFKFLIYGQKEFLTIVLLYSVLFSFSTLLMGRGGRIFVKSLKMRAKLRSEKPYENKTEPEIKKKSQKEEAKKSLVIKKPETQDAGKVSVSASEKKKNETENKEKVSEKGKEKPKE